MTESLESGLINFSLQRNTLVQRVETSSHIQNKYSQLHALPLGMCETMNLLELQKLSVEITTESL